MPHLHLPIEHNDADLILAANVAEVVGSEDLYVAWSHEAGPGAVPEVDAVLVEQRPLNPAAELLGSVVAGFSAFWRALLRRPRTAAPSSAPPADPARRTAEPSA